MPRKKHVCPRCGSTNAAKIVYGEPSENYLDNTPAIVGGCCISPESPTTGCLNCDYRWGGKSTKVLHEMTYFQAYVGGHFGPTYMVEAARGGAIKTMTRSVDMFEDGERITPVTPEAWDKLIQGLIRCDFLDWMDEYTDVNTLDGTTWCVDVALPYGQHVHKEGANAYPGRWNAFCHLMSNVSGVDFR